MTLQVIGVYGTRNDYGVRIWEDGLAYLLPRVLGAFHQRFRVEHGETDLGGL